MRTLLGASALGFAIGAAGVLLVYLWRRPRLTAATKVWLLFGIGVLPIAAAVTGNWHGFEVTKERRFCGSCHVMEPQARDAADPASKSLAAWHSRNPFFGERSCYTCHQDYRLFGTVTTKLAGMRHVWHYYVTYVWGRGEPIQIRKPFPNATCLQCHSTKVPGFREEAVHAAVLNDILKGQVSCLSEGCHGPAHPKPRATRPAPTRDKPAGDRPAGDRPAADGGKP